MWPVNSESTLASWVYWSATIAVSVAGSSLSTRPREGPLATCLPAALILQQASSNSVTNGAPG